MRLITPAVAALVVAAAPLAGQATRDQARIAFTISMGYAGGGSLWSVGRQPVADYPDIPDTLAVSRSIRPTVTVGFSSVYFPREHLGYVVEGYLLGLGFRDTCHLVYASGSTRNSEACSFINNAEKAATAVSLSGGLIYRVNSRRLVSPYARVAAGLLFSTQSSVRMIGEFHSGQSGGQLVDAIIYPDDHDSRVLPVGVLGVGFTASLGRGYQVRWEVRDNIAGIRTVTGATAVDGTLPPTAVRFKHLFSFNVGFDVVLERRRGRRY